MSTYMQIGMRRLVDRVITSPRSISEPVVGVGSGINSIGGIEIPKDQRTCFLTISGQRGRTVGYPSNSSKQGEFYDDGSSNVRYYAAGGSSVSGVAGERLYTRALGVPVDSTITYWFGLVSCFK